MIPHVQLVLRVQVQAIISNLLAAMFSVIFREHHLLQVTFVQYPLYLYMKGLQVLCVYCIVFQISNDD